MINKIGLLINYPLVDRSLYKLKMIEGLLEANFDIKIFFSYINPLKYIEKYISVLPKNRYRKYSALEDAGGHGNMVIWYSLRKNIPIQVTGNFNRNSAIKKISSWKPDVLISAGSGILRRNIIALPKYGILHIHQGFLPNLRGLNVIPFSDIVFKKIGYTIHLIDLGIDTGKILFREYIDYKETETEREISKRINQRGVSRLLDILINHRDGNWPEEKISHSEQSIQYYRMSYELQEFLSYGKNYDNKDLYNYKLF